MFHKLQEWVKNHTHDYVKMLDNFFLILSCQNRSNIDKFSPSRLKRDINSPELGILINFKIEGVFRFQEV